MAALKLKKDVKKSSYYVWFLGAKEAKGLRGTHFIRPVVEALEAREKDVEPFKVTLQVSAKGLKIVQNVLAAAMVGGGGGGGGGGGKKPKSETIKHFIPHNTIACVHQKDDVIACILLLFNPVTKCPLHVHAYRCDSLETASVLRAQLQLLIDRPENQKKFAEIEARLRREHHQHLQQQQQTRIESSIGSSDTGTSSKSESSDDRLSPGEAHVATLYDSVAAELRAKLNKPHDVPILLPPRDYDTVHRQKGNLTGIELRRCLNANIVGHNVKAKRMASSGGSSGIGSDHAPSPETLDVHHDHRYHDGQSTSDEDWSTDHDASLYLIDRVRPMDKTTKQYLEEHLRQKLAKRMSYLQSEDVEGREEEEEEDTFEVHTSPRDRFNDAKEKFLSLEKKSPEYYRTTELPIAPTFSKTKCFDHHPVPAPRTTHAKFDPKRRSIFNLPTEPMERESFRYAQEEPINKELKRRSFMEYANNWSGREAPKSSRDWDRSGKNSPRFRNSFAEPMLEYPPRRRETGDGMERRLPSMVPSTTTHHRAPVTRFDILQRTNSTLANNGRVGIASVHPY